MLLCVTRCGPGRDRGCPLPQLYSEVYGECIPGLLLLLPPGPDSLHPTLRGSQPRGTQEELGLLDRRPDSGCAGAQPEVKQWATGALSSPKAGVVWASGHLWGVGSWEDEGEWKPWLRPGGGGPTLAWGAQGSHEPQGDPERKRGPSTRR